MKMLFAAITIAAMMCGCITNSQNSDALTLFKPEWQGIETKFLPVQFGDVISFDINNTTANAIVLDFNKDEGGIWIGICFINNNKLFGTRIPSGYNGDCVSLLDCAYLNSNALKQFKKIKTEIIDINKIGIGSTSSATNFDDLLASYTWGLKQRTKKQTPCNEDVFGINVVRECYFGLDDFK